MSEQEPKTTISSRDKVIGEFERRGIDSMGVYTFAGATGLDLPSVVRIVREREAADGVKVETHNGTMDYDTAVMVAGWIDEHKRSI